MDSTQVKDPQMEALDDLDDLDLDLDSELNTQADQELEDILGEDDDPGSSATSELEGGIELDDIMTGEDYAPATSGAGEATADSGIDSFAEDDEPTTLSDSELGKIVGDDLDLEPTSGAVDQAAPEETTEEPIAEDIPATDTGQVSAADPLEEEDEGEITLSADELDNILGDNAPDEAGPEFALEDEDDFAAEAAPSEGEDGGEPAMLDPGGQALAEDEDDEPITLAPDELDNILEDAEDLDLGEMEETPVPEESGPGVSGEDFSGELEDNVPIEVSDQELDSILSDDLDFGEESADNAAAPVADASAPEVETEDTTAPANSEPTAETESPFDIEEDELEHDVPEIYKTESPDLEVIEDDADAPVAGEPEGPGEAEEAGEPVAETEGEEPGSDLEVPELDELSLDDLDTESGQDSEELLGETGDELFGPDAGDWTDVDSAPSGESNLDEPEIDDPTLDLEDQILSEEPPAEKPAEAMAAPVAEPAPPASSLEETEELALADDVGDEELDILEDVEDSQLTEGTPVGTEQAGALEAEAPEAGDEGGHTGEVVLVDDVPEAPAGDIEAEEPVAESDGTQDIGALTEPEAEEGVDFFDEEEEGPIALSTEELNNILDDADTEEGPGHLEPSGPVLEVGEPNEGGEVSGEAEETAPEAMETATAPDAGEEVPEETGEEPLEMAAETEGDAGGDFFDEEEEGPIALSEDELTNIVGNIDSATEDATPAAGLTEEAGEAGQDAATLANDDIYAAEEPGAEEDLPEEDLSDYESLEGAAAAAPAAIAERSEEEIEGFTAGTHTSKEDMRKMLAYLDGLFDMLPDSAVQAFSQSEYFKLYKNIMEDLDLA